MKAAEFLDVLTSRRSVRSYLPEPVPAGDLGLIIRAAACAPSGTNQQNWRFIAVTSAPLKESLRLAVEEALAAMQARIPSARGKNEFLAYGKYYGFFAAAPLVVAAVKRPYDSLNVRIMKRYGLSVPGGSSADIQGPSAAVQNMLLMAHALGYGACWMTGPLIARAKLEDLLGITAPDELLALVPIGRPAGALPASPGRRGIADILTVR